MVRCSATSRSFYSSFFFDLINVSYIVVVALAVHFRNQ